MARWTGIGLVLAALAAALAGCGSDKPSSPAPTMTPVLIEYVRAGGIRGREHRLVIRYRGHLVRREPAGLDPKLALAIGRLDAIVAARD